MQGRRITTIEWTLVIGALFCVDLLQWLLIVLGIGIFVDEFIEIFVGLSFTLYLLLRGQLNFQKALPMIIAYFGEAITDGGAPLWGLDGLYYFWQYKKNEAQRRATTIVPTVAKIQRPNLAQGALRQNARDTATYNRANRKPLENTPERPLKKEEKEIEAPKQDVAEEKRNRRAQNIERDNRLINTEIEQRRKDQYIEGNEEILRNKNFQRSMAEYQNKYLVLPERREELDTQYDWNDALDQLNKKPNRTKSENIMLVNAANIMRRGDVFPYSPHEPVYIAALKKHQAGIRPRGIEDPEGYTFNNVTYAGI